MAERPSMNYGDFGSKCWLVEDGQGYRGVTFVDPATAEGAYDGFTVTPLVRDPFTVSAALRSLIADDAYAMTFQTFGQYRTALLNAIDAASAAIPVNEGKAGDEGGKGVAK